MPKHVLITGASGLIGSRLTELLLHRGHQVSHLSRKASAGNVRTFEWNISNGQIDVKAFDDVDCIVHLAGAGISDKRWNEDRKKEILESRTLSSRLLCKTLASQPNKVQSFIAASAIGYYGFTKGYELYSERSEAGHDFLAKVVAAWEAEVDKITSLKIRLAKIRIGIVLSSKGGALYEMAKPVKWFIGSPLGSGRQYLSWILIDDLCGLFIKAIEDENMHGAYNGVAPNPVTNREFTQALSKVLNRPLWAPAVPAPVLKMVLGEMADMILNGNNVSAEKVKEAGYTFQYPLLQNALMNLLR
jgi:hypothetical protein